MTMPVLKAIERPGGVRSAPCITPPSGFCTSTSHSPISRARSTSDASPVRAAWSSSVPMM